MQANLVEQIVGKLILTEFEPNSRKMWQQRTVPIQKRISTLGTIMLTMKMRTTR